MAKSLSIPRARHKARHLAVQALYQWQITGQSRDEIVERFLTDQEMDNTVADYFKELVSSVSANAKDIDDAMAPLLDRSIDQLDPVECSILRIGVYELEKRLDVPYKVVLNEAIEAAKTFGAEESYKYVNGILDLLVPKYRSAEVGSAKTS